MRKLIVLAVAAVVGLVMPLSASASPRPAGGVERRTEPADAVSPARDYLLYRPAKLAPAKKRALVVFLHGCTQTAEDAMNGVPWNALADSYGFAVAYPEQSTGVDGNAGRCWNSGQSGVLPRGEGELETLARITRNVRDELGVPAGRVFIVGISSGAGMAGAMAQTYPDVYAAMGSVVGCSHPCGDPTGVAAYQRMGEHARQVPGFFVAGSLDYLINPAQSQGAAAGWVALNDFADDGERNDSVATVGEIEQRDAGEQREPGLGTCIQPSNNPCPADLLGWTDYPTTISRHHADDGRVIVESWLLHGLSHNYPGGHPTGGTFTDPHGPDVSSAMLQFFLAHAR